jgi:hypothetical protein
MMRMIMLIRKRIMTLMVSPPGCDKRRIMSVQLAHIYTNKST